MATVLPSVDWSARPTRFVLFTGKGGVGKTTVAAAKAVALADAGLGVLLVSTDPASNLRDVFEMVTGEQPSPVGSVAGLDVMDLDPQVAADEYRARVIGPYRGVLPDAEVAALEEKLAGACTVEVAAFDAFARLLAEPGSISAYDHVLFDTAPTGHTLRLLSLPAAWSDYLGADPDATSCLGPLGGLQDHRPVYAAAVEALRDARLTTVVLVARPDVRALAGPLVGDRIAQAYAAEQQQALEQLPASLDRLPAAMVALATMDLVGVASLRHLAGAGPTTASAEASSLSVASAAPGGAMGDLVDELERPGHGVILVTGKGGVGKTTVARLVAVALARRGHPVHLSTTDPAGQVPATEEDVGGLTTSAIDPEAATREYVAGRLDGAARSGLDQAHLDLLAEDLRSPCSQEVAVFQAFRRLLRRGRSEFVVIDTAPTGHTLLLLDVTGSFHRQVTQGAGRQPGHVVTPLMWLQDPAYSKVLIVTLAETTPVSEAAELQGDLRRAGIEPFGWIVNATLAGSGTRDPVLESRARLEARQFDRIAGLSPRVWTLPWDERL